MNKGYGTENDQALSGASFLVLMVMYDGKSKYWTKARKEASWTVLSRINSHLINWRYENWEQAGEGHVLRQGREVYGFAFA